MHIYESLYQSLNPASHFFTSQKKNPNRKLSDMEHAKVAVILMVCWTEGKEGSKAMRKEISFLLQPRCLLLLIVLSIFLIFAFSLSNRVRFQYYIPTIHLYAVPSVLVPPDCLQINLMGFSFIWFSLIWMPNPNPLLYCFFLQLLCLIGWN